MSANAPVGPTEVEWQLDAPDLGEVERWLAELASQSATDGTVPLTVRAKPVRRLVDRYFDTADWRVAHAGFTLRTRQHGRNVELTMKENRPADASGLRRRLELSEPARETHPAPDGEGPVARRVRALVGPQPLVEVFAVRTRRRPYSLRTGGIEIAEITLDETVVGTDANRTAVRLSRVEVEAVPEWADALATTVEALRAACGLQPAAMSKYEAGLQAAGVAVPGPPDLGDDTVGRKATVGALALSVVRANVRELIAREAGTRLGDDPEELHAMRVATRRLRSALDVFADAFAPHRSALEPELRWIAGELGAVRDLDVQLGRAEQAAAWAEDRLGHGAGEALAPLYRRIGADRAAARVRLAGALDSARWHALLRSLVALAREDPHRLPPASDVAAGPALAPLVDARRRAALDAARDARRSGDARDFHRLRVRVKRVRDAVEFTSVLYGSPARRFARKLVQLQDELGRIQDAEVGAARLLDIARAEDHDAHPLPPDAVFAMGGLAERDRQESEALRRALRSPRRRLDGRSWERLHAAMRDASKGA